MAKCPVCGFNNMQDRTTCLKCSAALGNRIRIEIGDKPGRRPLRPAWPAKLLRFGRRSFAKLAAALAVPLPENVPHRFPFVAAFLGLIPGLGQLYNHQPRKLLYLLPATAAGLILSIHFITTPYVGNVFIASTLFILMLSYADALVTAARINGQYFTFRNILAAITYPIFLLGFFGTICAVMAFLQWPFFTIFYAAHNYMDPVIRKGDRICGEGITYWLRDPKPGDVVRYDPRRFSVELPNPDPLDGDPRGITWRSDPQNGWERVMAAGGETFESRDGIYYVNGRRLSRDYYPLLENCYSSNFKMECPPGKYIIVMTSRPEGGDFINMLRAQTGDRAERYKGEDKLRPGGMGYAGIVTQGWEDSCIVDRKDILDRTWFRSHPSARRRFFQARGPRFSE